MRRPIAEDSLHKSIYQITRAALDPRVILVSFESRGVGAIEGRRRKDRGVTASWLDMAALFNRIFAAIEIKTKSGRLSKGQREMRADLIANGFPVIIARTPEELLDALQELGFPMRGRITA
jgi:hypothetical protein